MVVGSPQSAGQTGSQRVGLFRLRFLLRGFPIPAAGSRMQSVPGLAFGVPESGPLHWLALVRSSASGLSVLA